jgi:hemolysin D
LNQAISPDHTQGTTPNSAPEQAPAGPSAAPVSAKIITLRPPGRWHDPLQLMQDNPPAKSGRIVLWTVSLLVLGMMIWAAFGQLDIIATAEGKLVPQTLVKIVQPAESGVVSQLLVNEGDSVKAGQVLARLDNTVGSADKSGIKHDLNSQRLQERRIKAELAEAPMETKAGDDPVMFAQVQSQYLARRKAYLDGMAQEQALLQKSEQERKGALEIQNKLEQTLPMYKKSAEAYARLEKEGYMGNLVSAEKQRELIEKSRDYEAQQANVGALNATIGAQQKRILQLRSNYQAELQKELAEIRARIGQLQPTLDKSNYRAGLMELRAPQDGVVKELSTTTVGAVVQPGTVLMTLVPMGEQLYADVMVKNEDVGFVSVGQTVQIKLAAYPFQRYGMMSGKVTHLSADASEATRNGSANPAVGGSVAGYKARIGLEKQVLIDAQGRKLMITPGMQVVAEINQGKRSVLAYLLSPVQKAVSEAGRER